MRRQLQLNNDITSAGQQMGLFSRLFDKTDKYGQLSEAEMLSRAAAFLIEAEQLLLSDPQAALKLVKKRVNDYGNLFRCGKPLHERFADLVLRLIHKHQLQKGDITARPLDYSKLPSVLIIDAEESTLGRVVDVVGKTDQSLLFIRFPSFYGSPNALPHYAILELEVLYQFTVQLPTLLVYLDEVNLLIRRPFFFAAVSVLTRDVKGEDIPARLFDFANSQDGVLFDDSSSSTFGFSISRFSSNR